MHLSDLKLKPITELVEMANTNELEGANRLRKQELVFALLKHQAKKGEAIFGDGTLEVLQDGFGFLRSPDTSYLAGPDDIYVSPSQIRRFNLHTGDSIVGEIRTPKDGERYFALVKVDKVNGEGPENAKTKILFENLTPLHPDEVMQLERDIKAEENLTGRVIDIMAPIGKGQRGLIISPPKAGKTVLMQHMAHAITANHPECVLIVLLIDERPEEVTGDDAHRARRGGGLDLRRAGHAPRPGRRNGDREGQAPRRAQEGCGDPARFDHAPRARLQHRRAPPPARCSPAASTPTPCSARSAFSAPRATSRRAARSPIIATALIDTGSRMDDVIYEEFKGTGNMEIHLDRRMSEKRVYPSINVNRSGTRREELLIAPEILPKVWILRKLLFGMDELEATEFLLDKLRATKNNDEFFNSMKKG
jgi:transcription termination factor Rho